MGWGEGEKEGVRECASTCERNNKTQEGEKGDTFEKVESKRSTKREREKDREREPGDRGGSNSWYGRRFRGRDGWHGRGECDLFRASV